MTELETLMFITLSNDLSSDPRYNPGGGIDVKRLAKTATKVAEEWAARQLFLRDAEALRKKEELRPTLPTA